MRRRLAREVGNVSVSRLVCLGLRLVLAWLVSATADPSAPLVANISASKAPDEIDGSNLLGRTYRENSISFASISAHPRSGPSTGGTSIVLGMRRSLNDHAGVLAIDPSSNITCFFGSPSNVFVPALVLNETHLRCVSPPWPLGFEQAHLEVVTNGKFAESSSSASRLTFAYYDPPRIESISPSACTELTPTAFTVRGGNFSAVESLVCRFSPASIPARAGSQLYLSNGLILSDTEAECVVPPLHPGATRVELSGNGGVDFTKSSQVTLTVLTRFTVLSKYPVVLSKRGGIAVTVTGTGFREDHLGSMSCHFGDRAVEAVYMDRNHLSCRVPPSQSVDTVPFRVCWGNAVECVREGNFSYLEDLRLLHVSPRLGQFSGNTTVSVTLNRPVFSTKSKCLFGELEVPLQIEVGSKIGKCNTPPRGLKIDEPGSSASVNISVVVGDGEWTEGGISFSYLPSFDLQEIIPSNIPEIDSDMIRVIGHKFPRVDDLACLLGKNHAVIAVPALWISGEQIWCDFPATPPGSYSLVVVYGDQASSRSKNTLELRVDEAISVARVLPPNGAGGTIVTILGTNLASSSSAFCQFGPSVVEANEVVNSSCIRCVAPMPRQDHAQSMVPFSISSNGIHFARGAQANFTYGDEPMISSFDPSVVDHSISAITILIRGSGLDAFQSIQSHCRVGTSSATATVLNASLASCRLLHLPGIGAHSLELTSAHMTIRSTALKFMIVPSPRVSFASPSWVLSTRDPEDTILIHGANFTAWNLFCVFSNHKKYVRANWLSSSSALCRVPPLRIGVHDLYMSSDGISLSVESVDLALVDAIQLESVVPSIGWSGTVSVIRGRGFMRGVACRFGEGKIVLARYVNATYIECKAPVRLPLGRINLDILLNGTLVSMDPPLSFHSLDLAIDSFRPSSSTTLGGTEVRISLQRGNGRDVSHCRFGNAIVPASFSGERSVVCISPPIIETEIGEVSLETSGNGIDFAVSGSFFKYVRHPEVANIAPSSGLEHGGVDILVSGRDFPNTVDLNCNFGSGLKVDAQWVSNTHIFCTTPELAPGKYSIGISVNGEDSFDSGYFFTSLAMHTVTHVSPDFSPVSGGTNVSIRGTNFVFSRKLACIFDGARVLATFISPNELVCTSPKVDSGRTVRLSIANSDGGIASFYGSFNFYPDFRAHSLSPTTGSKLGGTEVSIRGSEFGDRYGSVWCSFGGQVVAGTVSSETLIKCRSPQFEPSVGQRVHVLIIYGKYTYPVPGKLFIYEENISIDHVYPPQIPSNTARQLSVHGGIFRHSSKICCQIGKYVSLANFVSKSQVYCSIDSGLSPGFYSLSVSNNCQDYSSSEFKIEILKPMQAQKLAPSRGLIRGGSEITISGKNFVPSTNLACRFAKQKLTPLRYINSTHMECMTPPKTTPGAALVEILIDDVATPSEPSLIYQYVDVAIDFISPAAGSVDGGTTVHITLGSGGIVSHVSHCNFGGSIVKALPHDKSDYEENVVICVSPRVGRNNGSTRVLLDLSPNGVDFSFGHFSFAYLANPEIDNIEPVAGPDIGGTQLLLNGRRFVNSIDLACQFRPGITVKARWLSEYLLVCTTPKLPPGEYSVKLAMNGIDYFQFGLSFTSYPQITVARSHPGSSPATGGSNIVVEGGPFTPTQEFVCRFGEAPIVSGEYLDASTLLCPIPADSKLAVSTDDGFSETTLQVSGNGIDFAEEIPFYFYTSPVLSEFLPSYALANQSTPVIIRGAYFAKLPPDDPLCKFGSVSVKAKVVSISKILCDAPPLDVGKVQVSASLNGGRDWSHASPSLFEYRQIPMINLLSPPGGPSMGKTMVSVKGGEYIKSPELCCSIDGIRVSRTIWISPEELYCEVPPRIPGRKELRIYADCSDRTTGGNSAIYEYYHEPVLLSEGPYSGPSQGGTELKILGRHLRPSATIFCGFNSIRTRATFFLEGFVTCLSPPKAKVNEKRVNVTVGDVSGIYHQPGDEIEFFYIEPPGIETLLPEFGSVSGNFIIHIRGSRLNETGELSCRFTALGDRKAFVVTGRVIDATVATCVVPSFSELDHQMVCSVQLSSNGLDWSARRLEFRYMPTPILSRAIPQRGPHTGGGYIDIRGSNFAQVRRYECDFGLLGLIPAMWRSESSVLCQRPAAEHPGKVHVSILVDGVERLANIFSYEVTMPASILRSFPISGPLEGGTKVTVFGANFFDSPTLFCSFGVSSPVPAHFLSKNEIQCVSPRGVQGKRSLQVSFDGRDFFGSGISSHGTFSYESLPRLVRVIPSNTPVGSSLNVTMEGHNFVNSPGLLCRFGYILVQAIYHSSRNITCLAPPLTREGRISVAVSTNGIDFSIDQVVFRVLEVASVLEVSPSVLQEGIEMPLMVKGANFHDSSGLFCYFGDDISMTPAQWWSSNSLGCLSPRLSLGNSPEGVTLSITNNSGRSLSSRSVSVAISTKANIVSMTPTYGYITGGTEVRLSSNHFQSLSNDIVCLFGQVRTAAITEKSVYKISCRAPPHEVGDVPLKLLGIGTHPIYVGTFSYIHEPVLTSIRPSHGSVDGGTQIIVHGSHLSNVTACIFASSDLVESIEISATTISDSKVLCKSPKMNQVGLTSVYIKINTNGESFKSLHCMDFSFRDSVRITSVHPTLGPDLGGTSITVNGSGFDDTPGLRCRFGGEEVVPALFRSNRQIVCITPVFATGTTSISVATNEEDYTVSPALFSFHGPLQTFSISPSIGSLSGGTEVRIHATNIMFTESLACMFGNIHVKATFLGPNKLACVSPQVLETGHSRISITLNGQNYHNDHNSAVFTYILQPEVLRITPNHGWKIGDTDVFLESRNLYLDKSIRVYCAFGQHENLVVAQTKADNLIKCKTPGYIGGKSALPVSLVYEGTTQRSSRGPIFNYIDAAVVASISPSIGTILGGTHVVVSGVNFRNLFDLQCRFENEAVPARFINNGSISCRTPPQKTPRVIHRIKVESKDGSLLTYFSSANFEFTPHPSVHAVIPTIGSSKGGTLVRIIGDRFPTSAILSLYCRFGTSPPILSEYISAQELRCRSPSAIDAAIVGASVHVSISVNGRDFVSSPEVTFLYIPPLRIMSVSPTLGTSKGGTSVTLELSASANLENTQNIVCHFGSVLSPGIVLSSEETNVPTVQCSSPPRNESDTIDVELSINGGNDKTVSRQKFSYYRDPVISMIEPSFGYIDGGESIRVLGSGFPFSSDLTCMFGSQVTRTARWISSAEVACKSPPLLLTESEKRSVQVSVAINGVDFNDSTEEYSLPRFFYADNPSAVDVTPTVVSADGGTLCVIRGKNLARSISCRFGALGKAVPILRRTDSEVSCKPPPVPFHSKYLSTEAEVFIKFGSLEFSPLGVWVSYVPHQRERANNTHALPIISSVEPNFIGSSGGYDLTVKGSYFLNRQGLACSFGDSSDFVTAGRFISSDEIRCLSPKIAPGTITVHAINGGSLLKSEKGFQLELIQDFGISGVEPIGGPVRGGTIVSIHGSFTPQRVTEVSTKIDIASIQCSFGGTQALAFDASVRTIRCLSPSNLLREPVKVQVSLNGGMSFSKSYAIFTYESDPIVTSIYPSRGGNLGGTSVLIDGNGFRNASSLKCRFGEMDPVQATFVSGYQLLCKSPPLLPSGASGLVNVEVTSNGVDYSSSFRRFEYRIPPSIESIWPRSGEAIRGGTKVHVRGSFFFDQTHLGCSFGDTLVRGTYINNSMLTCVSPSRPPGTSSFQVVGNVGTGDELYFSEAKEFLFYEPPSVLSIYPTYGSAQGGTLVFIRGSNFFNTSSLTCRFGDLNSRGSFIGNTSIICMTPSTTGGNKEVSLSISLNGLDFTRENLRSRYRFKNGCEAGHYCGSVSSSFQTPAPNGTYSSSNAVNFTLCSPGTFQPKIGQSKCLSCPVGFICPDFGLSKPVVCPAGRVCSETSLASPKLLCPRGHWCPHGTKTSSITSMVKSPGWMINNETGVLWTQMNQSSWQVIKREPPAVGSKQIEYPPRSNNLAAEQPIPCEIGSYCREGVASPKSVTGNYLTPQPCYNGYFCPRGSFTPEGRGPCPSGYYCPTKILAVECPPGTYCPGVGNVDPLPCQPGTFESRMGQVSCQRCGLGQICPDSGMDRASLCPAGYVCDSLGLSIPEKECPAAFYCQEGTQTADPDNTNLKGPIICPPGRYCIGAVAQRNPSMEWIPTREEGKRSPQPCPDGYYCEAGSYLPSGSGKCIAGHYCPKGTFKPIPVPVGTYSENDGDIAPTLCSPGTYSPVEGMKKCKPCSAGFSCEGYGTYEPRICQPGTYRSRKDQITCKICPVGTFAPHSGAIDITQCLQCQSARHCQVEGMQNYSISHAARDLLTLKPVPQECPRQMFRDKSTICRVRPVAICDKRREDQKNIFRDVSYYPIEGHTSTSHEILVLSKTLPGEDPALRTNDTIEIIRSCPNHANAYDFDTVFDSGVVLVGRNYRNSSHLSCRFRECNFLFEGEGCSASDGAMVVEGSFQSSTRVVCSLPLQLRQAIVEIKDDKRYNHLYVLIDISNDATRFSGDGVDVPYSTGSKNDMSQLNDKKTVFSMPGSSALFKFRFQNVSDTISNKEGSAIAVMDRSICMATSIEEGPRDREQGWYELPFMRRAHLSFDWRHIPKNLIFGKHYTLAIYARPSRCLETACRGHRVISFDTEASPCRQPLLLPYWFSDRDVDLHQVLNMTLFALDDTMIRVEVQILNGMNILSSDLFLKTMNIQIHKPERAKALTDSNILSGNGEKRKLSPILSFEERLVDTEYFFAARLSYRDTRSFSIPLNIPSRWNQQDRGQVLVVMNITRDSSATMANDNDLPNKVSASNNFRSNLFADGDAAKEATYANLETFHGVTALTGNGGYYEYSMTEIVLPYLPYFSNCHEFDSYTAIWALFESHSECSLPSPGEKYHEEWWRRSFPALPHRDDTRPVGPFDFESFYPVADWCERKLHCHYEEELGRLDELPRWFEASSGDSLFSVLRDPINYYQYTAREATSVVREDRGGQKHVKGILPAENAFIPVKVHRAAAPLINEECSSLCFPRTVTFDVKYYQVDKVTKRIVEIDVIFDDFDKDDTKDEYELRTSFRPLDYRELIAKFAYSRKMFCLIFILIGLVTVVMAFFFWGLVRLTTQLVSPPRLRFSSLWCLIFPPAFTGFIMGIAPTCISTVCMALVMRGYVIPSTGIEDKSWPVFKSIPGHYADKATDPNLVQKYVRGRIGFGLLAFGIVTIYEGSKFFIPQPALKNPVRDDCLTEEKRLKQNRRITVWKRSNMIFTSIIVGLFLVLIMEWSYWRLFGTYIWEAIICLKVLTAVVGKIVDQQLGEAHLSAPIVTAIRLVEGVATLAADDFIDFLFSHMVVFAFLLVNRMYIFPFQSCARARIGDQLIAAAQKVRNLALKLLPGKYDNNITKASTVTGRKRRRDLSNESEDECSDGSNQPKESIDISDTVEPIIFSHCSYCCEIISLLSTPFIILLLILFPAETKISLLYGIKEQDMQFYIIFALIITPFQIVSDIFIQGSLELFHGWQIHDYLLFCRHRVRQQDSHRNGKEIGPDESIGKSARLLDNLCFSSHFYTMTTMHVNGIIQFVLGIEIMFRSRYNPLGDPIVPLLLGTVIAFAFIAEKAIVLVGQIGREDMLPGPVENDWETSQRKQRAIKESDFEVDQRMTSESFRHKFLKYNRTWLVDRLPSLLTPRSIYRSRGYLAPQLSKVFESFNDISSDSGGNDGNQFESVSSFNASHSSIMHNWVKKARLRCKLKEAVAPLIEAGRVDQCHQCFTRKNLHVQTSSTFNDLFSLYVQKHGTEATDKATFKEHWKLNTEYKTLCWRCVQESRARRQREKKIGEEKWENTGLPSSSAAIIKEWHELACRRTRIPSDETDTSTNDATGTLAMIWLHRARANLRPSTD